MSLIKLEASSSCFWSGERVISRMETNWSILAEWECRLVHATLDLKICWTKKTCRLMAEEVRDSYACPVLTIRPVKILLCRSWTAQLKIPKLSLWNIFYLWQCIIFIWPSILASLVLQNKPIFLLFHNKDIAERISMSVENIWNFIWVSSVEYLPRVWLCPLYDISSRCKVGIQVLKEMFVLKS